jgi:hypothetical protein
MRFPYLRFPWPRFRSVPSEYTLSGSARGLERPEFASHADLKGFAADVEQLVKEALIEGLYLTADLQLFLARNRMLARRYVAFACERASENLEQLRNAAIAAAAYDQSFWQMGDGLFETVVARADELGYTAKEEVQSVARAYGRSCAQFVEDGKKLSHNPSLES